MKNFQDSMKSISAASGENCTLNHLDGVLELVTDFAIIVSNLFE